MSLSIPFEHQQNGLKTGSLHKQQLMFFLNVWIYFELDEPIFQKFIVKPPNPTPSVFSKLLQNHQIIHIHQRKTNQIKDLILKNRFWYVLKYKKPRALI